MAMSDEKGTVFGREPALWAGLVAAVMYLLTEFGVDLTSGQQAAVMGVVFALLSFVVRQRVTPYSRPRRRPTGSSANSG